MDHTDTKRTVLLTPRQHEQQQQQQQVLPSDMWFHVWSFLDPLYVIFRMSCVSKTMHSLLNAELRPGELEIKIQHVHSWFASSNAGKLLAFATAAVSSPATSSVSAVMPLITLAQKLSYFCSHFPYTVKALIYYAGACDSASLLHLATSPNFRHLEQLNLVNNRAVSAANIPLLSGLRHLRNLNVGGCVLVDDVAVGKILEAVPTLEILDLSACVAVSLAGLRLLKKAVRLKALFLEDCPNVTDAGLQELVPCLADLEILNVFGCTSLTPEGIEALSGALTADFVAGKRRSRVRIGNDHLWYM
jgi:hypothetical protein